MGTRERKERRVMLVKTDDWSDVVGKTQTTGWSLFTRECCDRLNVEPSGLCVWFDANVPTQLAVDQKHRFIEPAVVHFFHHSCGHRDAVNEACAAARAILVLGTAIRELGEPELSPAAASLRTAIKHVRKAEQEMRKGVSKSMDLAREKGNESARMEDMLTTLRNQTMGVKQNADALQHLLTYAFGSHELLRTKKTDRPALVHAEAELLEGGWFPEEKVVHLLRDTLGKSPSDKRLKSRREGPTWTLRVSVAG